MAKIKRNTGKRTKLGVTEGIAHIQSTFNNTIITITDSIGNTLSCASAGRGALHG